MTEAPKPKTIKLEANDWKVLAVSNVAQLLQGLQNIDVPSEEICKSIHDHIDKLNLYLDAWRRFAPPAPLQAEAPPSPAPQAPTAEAKPNGAAQVEPRKGGWPKGKKRTRTAAAPQVQ